MRKIESALSSHRSIVQSSGNMANESSHNSTTSTLLLLFFLTILTPVTLYVNIFESVINPYRLFIVLTAPLILMKIITFPAQFRSYDYFILAFLIWSILCLVLRSVSFISIGLHAAETVFAYALARFFIRSTKHFWMISRWFFIIVLVSVPIAAAESVFREHFVSQLGTALSGATYASTDAEAFKIRWNLARATTFFSHPILFGLFCATALPLAWYGQKSYRTSKMLFTAAGAFFSLSSAAWLAWALNALLIASEQVSRMLRGRGLFIAGFLFSVGLAVQVFSKSGFFSVVVRYMSLDSFTAGNRIRIWDYGLKTMYEYPIFGIEPIQWIRLPWMVSSLDNHWLLTGVAFGFPGLTFLLLAFAAVTFRLLLINGMRLPPVYRRLKAGWAIATFTLALSGLSVAYFGKSQPLFFFLLGMGAALVPVLEREVERRGVGRLTQRDSGAREGTIFRPVRSSGHV